MIKFILYFILYLISAFIGYLISIKECSKKGEFFKNLKATLSYEPYYIIIIIMVAFILTLVNIFCQQIS